MNLAGVLPWIHWRGLLILGLLVAGNVFCMACPFMLPRTLARRWLPQGRSWPRWLRNKWLAVVLLVVFLWAYEAFALWDSPWWTAWIVLAYFAAAFVIDGFFRGASFCKYVCPIGQFNFVQSLVSPLEIKVRDPAVCASCRTKDCIRGRDDIPGCELHLFQPRKSSNMDCTFCLDCVHACPHDNVGILAGPPGRELWHDPFARASAGSATALTWRPSSWCWRSAPSSMPRAWSPRSWSGEISWRRCCGQRSPLLVTSLFLRPRPACPARVTGRYIGGALPLVRAGSRRRRLEVATRFSYALVPLGFSMWLAHYSFHFLASFDAVIPALQRFAGDLGWTILGQPAWARACCRPVADWLPRLEILFLDLGLLLSLYSGYRIAQSQSERASQSPEDAGALGVADRPSVRGRSLDRSSTHADAWNPCQRQDEHASTGLAGVLLGWLFLRGIWLHGAAADGGSMRSVRKKGGYQITVFTAPTPFRAGPVDISVLVQDASTGDRPDAGAW